MENKWKNTHWRWIERSIAKKKKKKKKKKKQG
jgi:uncharacterized protein with PIN domain